jgi:hypothetical protein
MTRNRRPPEERPLLPLPAETLIDTEVMLSGERRMQHWLDEAYASFVENGGLKNLPGLGKPLVVPTGDVFSSLLKNAQLTHPWIMLRQEIRASIEKAVKKMDQGAPDEEVNGLLEEINRRIADMNVQAPSLALHRRKVNRENIRSELTRWF